MKVKLLKKIRKRFEIFYDNDRIDYGIIAYDKNKKEFLNSNKWWMKYSVFLKGCLETIFIYSDKIDKINNEHEINYKKRRINTRLKQLRK